MNILKSINKLRRVLMRSLTKHIRNQSLDQNAYIAVNDVKRILICRPNHRLGNLLLITPLLQEVIATFPHGKIDLFVKGNLAPTLFKNYGNINQIIQLPRKPFQHLIGYIQGWILIKTNRYDFVINVDKNSSSGRMAAQFANSKYKFFGDDIENVQSEHEDHAHIAKCPVYNLRKFLARLGFVENDRQMPLLDLNLEPFERAEGQKILKNLVKNEKRTICLFTYATGEKCFSDSWWAEFYERLRAECQNHNIIEVLPVENVSKIAFKAPTFYSKDIRQIGSLIANTEIFIGADSGIMHLASAVQIPTVGLFSITDPNIYQPYNQNSIGINTNKTDTQECIDIIKTILSKN